MSATFALLAAWAAVQPQEDKPAAAGAETFPRWTVHGVLSTDAGVIVAEKHQRDTVPEEGITGEYAIGGTLHLAREVRVNLRSCFGCHGFEVHEAYADVDLAPGLTVRAGRFGVPFGGLSRRVSPAHVESGSKPLPYIMGWMVREREFNLGVVPAPFVDNGFSLQASAWLGADVQLTFEAAAVRGLKGTSVDFDYELSREFEDNNGEPAGAARATLAAGAVTLGASATAGHFDADGALGYALAGADFHLRLGDWNLRLEAVWRETEYLDAGLREDRYRRLAYAAQIDVQIHEQWRVFVLNDALAVEDIFVGPFGVSPVPVAGGVDDRNTILRGAAGVVFALRPGVLFKGSGEFWSFSDFDDAWVLHAAVVVAF